MNEGSFTSTSSVVERMGGLGVSASLFPRTRPSYPSLTIHVSQPLHFSRISPSKLNHHSKRRRNTLENAGFDDSTHCSVHAGAVASRREHCKLHSSLMNFPQDLVRFLYYQWKSTLGVRKPKVGQGSYDKISDETRAWARRVASRQVRDRQLRTNSESRPGSRLDPNHGPPKA